MGIVARGAFAVFGGLMLDFELGLKIVVASEAHLRLRPFHLYRKARLMAFVALFVFVWRMSDKFLFRWRGLIWLRYDQLIERFAVLVVLDRRRIRAAGGRNPIKEEREPFLFFIARATYKYNSTQRKQQQEGGNSKDRAPNQLKTQRPKYSD